MLHSFQQAAVVYETRIKDNKSACLILNVILLMWACAQVVSSSPPIPPLNSGLKAPMSLILLSPQLCFAAASFLLLTEAVVCKDKSRVWIMKSPAAHSKGIRNWPGIRSVISVFKMTVPANK